MTEALWEATYSDLAAKSFGDASQEIVALMPLLPAGAKVLDLGSGDGRNAIPLARAGFNVTAIDISKTGIQKLNTLSMSEGLSIQASVGNMTTFVFHEKYDLIISHGCLHFVERNDWERLIKEFKTHTILNGLNVITVFTNDIQAPPDLEDLCIGLFNEGELYDRYSEWEIVLKKSYTFNDEHVGG
ncbi:MAG: methyltransferase domain-containing protein, partial [Proteobacteria bacterium]|nr:methyltransferase domain-containing protein [Pseudomonadota bacterium]